ncbi:ATP-dependent RNA helicase ddx18 [Dimargaris cristalligena]|uniref:ATP-dependent RNA helicase n=1 Tax=Dimargaris cristalligena TaxID=215637 RepID=A0A4P9ZWN6_9FUNG|nr:ATP-dependent RNA helicase ddx18 [Dimargaris cristalligena]RKP38085.1 P-loop containing nucleoside triphosphate hydrolase protein [Dimargaris cristalligena]|eukprot:RKP38085.1 P-loop containing nucleoside triphosphate hydrolase protein [Dimargaris cristalligena]
MRVPEEAELLTVDDLDISDPLKGALSELGIHSLTDVQATAIPLALQGEDLTVTSPANSGKTLAYLIPVVARIVALMIRPRQGLRALIICHTPDRAVAVYRVLKHLAADLKLGVWLATETGTQASQEERLRSGVNILVATAPRFVKLMRAIPDLHLKAVQCLVVDETDSLLTDTKATESLQHILKHLPITKRRQTLQFSTQAVNPPAKTVLERRLTRKDTQSIEVIPSLISADVSSAKKKTVVPTDDLPHVAYTVCTVDQRLPLLRRIHQLHASDKLLVLFTNDKLAQFYSALLQNEGVPVTTVLESKPAGTRSDSLAEFESASTAGLLITTAALAAQWSYLPTTQWVIQFETLDDIDLSRRLLASTSGSSSPSPQHLLLLLENESPKYLTHLKKAGISTEAMSCKIPTPLVVEWQSPKAYVHKIHWMYTMAHEAYRNFIRAYNSYQHQDVFSTKDLPLPQLKQAFCLDILPQVPLEGTASKLTMKVPHFKRRRMM